MNYKCHCMQLARHQSRWHDVLYKILTLLNFCFLGCGKNHLTGQPFSEESKKKSVILFWERLNNATHNYKYFNCWQCIFWNFLPSPCLFVPRTPLYVLATLYIMSSPYFALLGPKTRECKWNCSLYEKNMHKKASKRNSAQRKSRVTRRKYKIFLCRLTPATNIGFTKRANFANLLNEAVVMFVIYVKALSVSSAATVRAAARPPRLSLAHSHSHILTLYYRDT